ncbi:permease-like cell division protein FtsX [Thermasporomyces composti]|jgi:cell division transport system permease protein|uniref:Cell division protein FtsX n=1 Tax=Thermasporomyces composti TaxID=696763 RepID=A0A3D9VHB5_THECX|nr:permease-like cell division protein FtsX [Thermasporomyces composti]REF37584.1 cell division protein FtsX [Thermasporomyces composti]
MQIRYAFSELGTGLRRNVTMTVAVIVTVWISLVLFGFGLLVRSEVELAKGFWYDKVEIAVFLCNDVTSAPQCADGAVSEEQKAEIKRVLVANPEVRQVYHESQEEAYERYKQIYKDSATVDLVKPSDLQESFRVSLKDPQQYHGVRSAVQGLPGVFSVQDSREVLEPLFKGLNGLQWVSIGLAGGLLIAAVLQISNTIRLTVFSRRREISIMRLVGASNFYIQLPFVIESMVAALAGGLLACATLAFTPYVTERLRTDVRVVPWIGWDETLAVMPVVLGVGALLAVVASLVTLRRYLQV